LAQAVFGFLAYREITESRGDQLTIFLQYLSREIAERIMLPGNIYVSEIYLEELRQKFSTPHSILIIQEGNKILYIAGELDNDISIIEEHLKQAYSDLNKHGLIEIDGVQFYWAVSPLPDENYQLVMFEPAGNEETTIAYNLKWRLATSGLIILWIAIWISLFLSSRISEQLDDKNEQLKYLASHDSLTDLPNRTLHNDRLKQVLLQAQRTNNPFSLFIMDLDRFKEINDTRGHQFGDELLKMVSSRLSKAIRKKDSIARLGGDEFSVLFPDTDFNGTKNCVSRIIQSMEVPFDIDGVITESKISIGIAIYPEHGDSVETLMQHADIAMYQAKRSQSGYAIYDQRQNTHTIRRLQLMNDLRDTINKNKTSVYYQPLIDNNKKTVTCVEALSRWQHDTLGDISPDEFIPMAEQMGLIRMLTLHVLKQSLHDLNNLKKEGYNLGVNINISTHCLQDMSFPEDIYSIVKSYSFEASQIELEITESALMHDLSRARKIINQLSKLGFKLAIDDFGTGFSSLNYLKNLPIDTLKIDKSFIADICDNNNDYAIVKTIIELGHNLGCSIVAEGVENQMQLESLNLLKVDIIQGFFYSKPLAINYLSAWLRECRESGSRKIN
jgi:diguanylate cyclase (GGDEF)-like protein